MSSDIQQRFAEAAVLGLGDRPPLAGCAVTPAVGARSPRPIVGFGRVMWSARGGHALALPGPRGDRPRLPTLDGLQLIAIY